MPGNLLTALDDPCQSLVLHGDLVFHAAFAAELELDRTAVDLHMSATQGGQAVGAVVPCVLSVADSDQRGIQQGDDGGHDFVAAEAWRGQQRFQLLAQFRQGLAEISQARVFVGVAHFAPARVIAILLAAAGVAAGGLQVTARIGANPHVGVGRWHREGIDAPDFLGGGDTLTRRIEVAEFTAQLSAGDSGQGVIDVVQVGRQRIGHGDCPWQGIRGRYSH
ncbi:hypothetical protein D3C84_563750 [compost metagenome]